MVDLNRRIAISRARQGGVSALNLPGFMSYEGPPLVVFFPRKEDDVFKFDNRGYGDTTNMEIINLPSDTQLSIETDGPAGDYFRYQRNSSGTGAGAGQLGLWFKLENSSFNLDSYKPVNPAPNDIKGFTFEFWYRHGSAPGAANNVWGLGLRGGGTPFGGSGWLFTEGPLGFHIACRQVDDADGRRDELNLSIDNRTSLQSTILQHINVVPTPVWSHIRVIVNGELLSWFLNGSLLETYTRQPGDNFEMTNIRGFTFYGGQATLAQQSSFNVADNHFQLVRAYPFPLETINFTPPTDGFVEEPPE
jgi:hypothetical protein